MTSIAAMMEGLLAASKPEASAMVDPLLLLAIVLVAGVIGGEIARRLHVPGITGNIIAGALLGVTLLRNVDVAAELRPLSDFAIGLIAVTAGGHFSYRRIHNALRRILFISFFEFFGALICVLLITLALGEHWTLGLMLGVMATASAPATTVALIRENRAKGPAVKTLLASVSVDSALCILLFAFVHGMLVAYFDPNIADELGISRGIASTTWALLGSAVLGVVLGLLSARLSRGTRFHGASFMLIAVMLATGISAYLSFSPLLTCLFFGAYLGNSSPRNERQLDALLPLEPMLYTAFFTLAGISLHVELLMTGGLLFMACLVARAIGKGLGAYLGAMLANARPRIRNSVPFGFVPQAGVALGLVVILQSSEQIPAEFSSLVVTLTLASVTVNEIVGPFFTRYSLQRSGEAGLDRPRLVEFLQEEFVLVGLEAKDKWEAIEKLVDFYALTHRVANRERNLIYDTVVAREKDGSTAIGREAALPHGWVETGRGIEGVLGILPEGVAWDSPDDLDARIVVLIVTPREQEQRHLEVLASLSAMAANDRWRARLIAADDPNDAWEILESRETRDYNYFLEGDEPENGGSRNGTQSAATGS